MAVDSCDVVVIAVGVVAVRRARAAAVDDTSVAALAAVFVVVPVSLFLASGFAAAVAFSSSWFAVAMVVVQ